MEMIVQSIAEEIKVVARGGGVTPLYGLYRYVQPQRVWFITEPFLSSIGYRI